MSSAHRYPPFSPDGSHMTAEPTDIGEVESVGTLVQILEMTDTSEGNLRMVLEGHRRYVAVFHTSERETKKANPPFLFSSPICASLYTPWPVF